VGCSLSAYIYIFLFFIFIKKKKKKKTSFGFMVSLHFHTNNKNITHLEHLCDIASTIDSVNASKSLRIIGREIKRENAIGRASSPQILASCTTARDHASNPIKNLTEISQKDFLNLLLSQKKI
jgi:hypothetical protein